ncbi:MAG: hypothetical protein EAX95_05680 [Candidatus Thorarchaeota archaeon]|nr:hypothetical protein [Candidatus Thorarchaeota archaeon]
MKIAVVGYGPGGVAAATAARAFDPKAEIVIITQEVLPAHKKPGATMILEDADAKELYIKEWTPDSLRKKRIDVISNAAIVGGDARKKELEMKLPDGKSSPLKFDRLILATGGTPAIPNIPGVNLRGVFTIQDASDALRIAEDLESMKSIVIVGAGFSGLEAAERFHKIGKEVHLVVRSRLMRRLLEPPLSDELVARIPKSIHVHTGFSPKAILGDKGVTGIILDDKELTADAVLFLTGVKPNVTLAEKIGLTRGELGGIPINEKMQTEIADVYAVGDCAEMKDFLTQKPILMPIGSTAARAGRQAGVASVGGTKIYRETSLRLQYDSIFGTDIICVGHSSTTAAQYGISTTIEYLDDKHEAMKTALVIDATGRLIGGQVLASRMGARIGYEILDRVESRAILAESPISRSRHDRLVDLIEETLGPMK